MTLSDVSVDLLEHARSTRWRGRLTAVTHRGTVRNARCGDEMLIEIHEHQGAIAEIRYSGRGCFISQAAASLLCENIHEENIEEVKKMSVEDLLGFSPSILTAKRQLCALLGYQALQKALEAWKPESLETQ